MRIPYVIDNQNHLMVDILDALLAEHKGRSLDVATAYFTVNGFGLVRAGDALLTRFLALKRQAKVMRPPTRPLKSHI